MEQNQPLQMRRRQEAEQDQTIYVDGCKVTVRYSGKKNPNAVRGIKDILLASITNKKA